MGYIFSVPINSSSIISIDYNIRRSSRALKRPQSITQGRLVFIFCLINTNKTVQQDGPSTFQGSKWFCMYFMRKFNSSWYRIPRGKYMAGLSGLFRSPGRKVNTNLNTSLLRVIYISTTQGLGCSMNCVCGSLTSALETQGSSSVALLLPCPSISKPHTPLRCYRRIAKRQHRQTSVQVSHSLIEAP